MKNKRFELYVLLIDDLIANILSNATPQEQKCADRWCRQMREKHSGYSEQDFAEYVDAELPELAARCATLIPDRFFSAYLLYGDKILEHI